MYARVIDTYPLPVITAFGGHEYTKRDWRLVPPHEEAAARRMAAKGKDSKIMIEISDSQPEAAPTAPKPAPPPPPAPVANMSKSVRLVRKRPVVEPAPITETKGE